MAPWAGSAGFCCSDDDIFEDSNDIGGGMAEPTSATRCAELESSDTDSEDADVDDGRVRLGRSDLEETPDIFETNADLNAGEYSESAVVSSC